MDVRLTDPDEPLATSVAKGLQEQASIADDGIVAIEMINVFYKAKDLEYFVFAGMKTLPSSHHLRSAAHDLINGLAAVCCPPRSPAVGPEQIGFSRECEP